MHVGFQRGVLAITHIINLTRISHLTVHTTTISSGSTALAISTTVTKLLIPHAGVALSASSGLCRYRHILTNELTTF